MIDEKQTLMYRIGFYGTRMLLAGLLAGAFVLAAVLVLG